LSLAAGREFSHYRLVEKIGEGGMGVVWKALDTRLDRHIAVKVLPPELTADDERRRRFLREARTAAAVTHPNIVTIHEIDEADGFTFIAMELVEGRTLRAVIGTDPLQIPEAVRIATGIAAGLARAHRARIVHRDLKPDNVVIGTDGRPRILDFGLAKLVEQRQKTLRTHLSRRHSGGPRLTVEGTLLGTSAYMSPEQARGEAVDARSDIFSFGITLYEMLTAQLPFPGQNQIERLAAILHSPHEPASRSNPAVPPWLDRILVRCLEKDPGRRYQDIQGVLADLEQSGPDLEPAPERRGEPFPAVHTRTQPGLQRDARSARAALPRALLIAAGGATLLALAAGVVYYARQSGRPHPAAPRFVQLTRQFGLETQPSLSPDGKWVAYVSGDAIYLQAVGGENPINLTKDSLAGDSQPAFSPDGERLAFRSEREGGGVFVMGRTGESPRRVARRGFDPAWSPDGEEIVYSTRPYKLGVFTGSPGELWAVNVASGEERKIYPGDASQPHWSPQGHRIVFVSVQERGDAIRGRDKILTVPATGHGEAVPLAACPATDWNPTWSPDGRSVYFVSNRGGTMNLWRIPVDEKSGKPLGDPEPLSTPSAFASDPSLSADGRRIAYSSAAQGTQIQRISIDPATATVRGTPTSVVSGSGNVDLQAPDVTRDGAWIAYVDFSVDRRVWIVRADGTGKRDIMSPAGVPSWSPDGSLIAFNSPRAGVSDIWRIHRDGTGLERLTDAKRDGVTGFVHPVYSPDGSRIAFHTAPGKQGNAFMLDLRGGRSSSPKPFPRPTFEGEYFDSWSWSPDGKHLAGNAIDAIIKDAHEGVVIYTPDRGTYEKLTDFGVQPNWLPDGRRLVFTFQEKLYLLDRVTRKTRLLFSVPPPEYLQWPRSTKDAIYFMRTINEADIWMMEIPQRGGR